MPILADVAPQLVSELRDALTEVERSELAGQLATAAIERFTYEPSDDLGYVYLARPKPSAHFASLSAPVAETVVFYLERGINVDVDHDGHLFGIELVGRHELIAEVVGTSAL